MVKIQDRIEVLSMVEEPIWGDRLHAGDKGTVESIGTLPDGTRQVWVKFDNGIRLALLEGVDLFRVIPRTRPKRPSER